MNTIKIFISLALSIAAGSCKKFVEVDPPIDQITSEKVFANDKTAASALAGIYISMSTNGTTPIISNGAVTVYAGLCADELFYTGTSVTDKEFATNSISTGNSIVNANFWRNAYQLIYQANAAIEGVQASTRLSPDTVRQITGELKFLRSFMLFYLSNLFGEIPLTTTTEYQYNASLGRSSISEIYSQIISDLTEAKTLLPATYPTNGRLRANKWATTALLSRVYLYNKEWLKAEVEATEVVNSGLYSLLADLSNVFLPSSNESLWQLYPFTSSLSTIEGNKFIPSSSASIVPVYPLSPGLVSSFENGDQRKVKWANTKTVSGTTYYYPYKYKVRNIAANALPPEYTTMLRYSEVFLIRAEARAHQNKIIESVNDLNLVRQRAGLPSLSNNISQTALLNAIEKERRVELFAEWGHRWLDLKRTNRANEVLNSKPNWQSTDVLFPIPQTQILLNPSLTQNDGY